jgi:hypothetical protein
VEAGLLGWEWGFWGKSAISRKTFEKAAKSSKTRCIALQGAARRLKA